MAGSASAGGFNINTGTADALQAAGTGLNNALNYTPTDLSAYQNPYQQDVIDASLADLDRSRQMTLNNQAGEATMAGAFGGSRQGIYEAETNRAFADQAAKTTAGLNAANFNQAQQAAMANQNLNMNAANSLSNLANLGFGMGRTVNQDLMAQGSLQQALQQALIDAGKGQFGGFAGSPTTAQNIMNAGLGISTANLPTTQTSSYTPGLFDYLTLGGNIYGAAKGAAALCWVAREVYGEQNPAWLEFRSWLMAKAPAWFRNLYIRKGEAFAGWLKKNAWAKRIIKPLMNRARKTMVA